MQKINILMAFSLFTLPSICNASHSPIASVSLGAENNTEECAPTENCGGLSLADFTGSWVFTIDSVGGLSGANRIGTSQTLDGQARFDKKGIGKINFGANALYAGVPGQILIVNFSNQATITITITDSRIGVGTIVVNDPQLGVTETFDMIVRRSKSNGKAIEIIGHRIGINANASNLYRLNAKRQFE
jgi:hypothetical protein